MRVTRYILFLCAWMIVADAYAQNVMTSSPYSQYGIGEMSTALHGQNVSMASVSVGMRDGLYLNLDNPAGLTALDSAKLIAEVSVFGKNEHYRSLGSSNNALTGNFGAFSIGVRLKKRWFAAAGVAPFSFVGYHFRVRQEVEGASGSYFSSTFEGSGGLSRAYLSQAFLIGKHLSVGANLNFIFGDIELNETQSAMEVSQKLSGRAFYADFGAQYHRLIGKETFLSVGAVYGYKQKIVMDNELTVTGSSTVTDYPQRNKTQYIPQYFGVGGSLRHKSVTYGLDYLLRQYGSIHSTDSRMTFADSHEVRMGVRYYPGGYSSASIWKRMSYKAGFSFSTPYLRVSNHSGQDYRVTAGLEFPVSSGILNTSLYYDYLRLTDNTLERGIFGITVTFTLGERFYRVKL